MVGLERNGDVVTMASYAPLFAKKDHTQWKTDMIFFDNSSVCFTPNYYVQKLFSLNQGDWYINNVITHIANDTTLAASCVRHEQSGDIILKLVNTGVQPKVMSIDLNRFKKFSSGEKIVLSGDGGLENTLDSPDNIIPVKSAFPVAKKFDYSAPPMSLTVIRLKRN